jgi:colanic acid/amylovoran biosynthesis protein
MKILLADCYHDSDKGGGGMIAGAVGAIRHACKERGEEAEISLMFRFSGDDPKFLSAARHTAREFPDCRVLPAPVSSRRGPGLHWISWGARVMLSGTFRLLAPSMSAEPAVMAMREADIIIFKGGNFYRSWSSNPVADWIATFLLFFPAILARRMGKKYAFMSHTFGPFETRTAERLVRRIVTDAMYISAREQNSQAILAGCGIPVSRIAVAPDFGFGAYPAAKERAFVLLQHHGLVAGDFVAFTARPWFYADRRTGDSRAFDAYVEASAALLDHALETHVGQVALVVQNDGAHSRNEPDLPVLQAVLSRMRHPDRTVIIDRDYSFDDLCAIYGQARLMLGTRLHSCIFAFIAGTPPIAIAYSHKGPGIMSMMGLERYVLDISEPSIDRGKQLLGEMFASETALRAQIAKQAPRLRDSLYRSAAEVLFTGTTTS